VNNENRKDYSIYRVSVLLGYRTASLGKWLRRFETTYWSHFKGGIIGEAFVVNTALCQLPNDAASCSRNLNPLTPNDPYRGRTAPLTSKRCILYIYSTAICTEYFKHGIYSPFLSLQNAVCFIILTYLVPVLFTFYI